MPPRLEKRVRVAMDWTLDLRFTKGFRMRDATEADPNARFRPNAAFLTQLMREPRKNAGSLERIEFEL
jgi:hypothetical protein